MALNASGQISLGGSTSGQSINLELNQLAAATITMNDTNVRTLGDAASGAISLNMFYGKAYALDYAFLNYLAQSGNSEIGGNIKITYSTDVVSAAPAPVQQYSRGAYQWQTTNMFLVQGGLDWYGTSAMNTKTSELWGINYATQTAINPANPVWAYAFGMCLNDNTSGYAVGGASAILGSTDVIQKMTFSSYTYASIGNWPVTGDWYDQQGEAQTSTTGYRLFSGLSPFTRRKIVFATNTISAVSNAASAEYSISVFQNKTTSYYYGAVSPGNSVSTGNATGRTWVFSTETYGTFASSFQSSYYQGNGTGNVYGTWNSGKHRGASNNIKSYHNGDTPTNSLANYFGKFTFASTTRIGNLTAFGTLNNTFASFKEWGGAGQLNTFI